VTRHPDRLLAIAHRSGNTLVGLREALDAGVDLVEADVHAFRGILEVRHHKHLGPTHLWDKGEIVARTALVRVELIELLEELGEDPRLMIDLKGVRRSLAPDVADALRTVVPGSPITVCTKHWWMLDAFDPPVRRVLSASTRYSLCRLRRRVAATKHTYGVSVQLDRLTPQVVDELRAKTDVVMTWPVDTPAALTSARRLGVDGVISKDLDLLAQVLAGR
jgi:glycerophosphoryl diester phosphodiesterase